MGDRRGRLTLSEDREKIIGLIDQAVKSGAKRNKACEIAGISIRTLQRWSKPDNAHDGRTDARHEPANKLSEEERREIKKVANAPGYSGLPPCKIVPALADSGLYIASESTFYRVLKEQGQMTHRHRSKPKSLKKPKQLKATGPNQIYSWDITWLPASVGGIYFYLYMVMDIYSRKIVGWQVYEKESSALAADLMTDICHREAIEPDQVTLHSDNGGAMRGSVLLVTLEKLGVIPSFSRSGVSSDNAYSESLFRTMKYVPYYPHRGFEEIVQARWWVDDFVRWYNTEHLHSAIKFVTPQQRHEGLDKEVLSQRARVYERAKAKNPSRWSGKTRNWSEIPEVFLNPDNYNREVLHESNQFDMEIIGGNR